MPIWTDAHLAETSHLSALEHGGYCSLWIAMWRAGGSLPDDDKRLARFARMTPKQWKAVGPVLRPLFQIAKGLVTHPRLLESLQIAVHRSRVASANAQSKALKYKLPLLATALPPQLPPVSGGNAVVGATGVLDKKKVEYFPSVGDRAREEKGLPEGAGDEVELQASGQRLGQRLRGVK